MRVYWADLHNHNEVGYGRGSLERSYEIAKTSLDIFALSAHGHWPDPPESDPSLVSYHEEGFDRVKKRFPELIRAAKQ